MIHALLALAVAAFASVMQRVPRFIVDRQLDHFDGADPAYGAGVREAIASQGTNGGHASLTTSHAAEREPPVEPATARRARHEAPEARSST